MQIYQVSDDSMDKFLLELDSLGFSYGERDFDEKITEEEVEDGYLGAYYLTEGEAVYRSLVDGTERELIENDVVLTTEPHEIGPVGESNYVKMAEIKGENGPRFKDWPHLIYNRSSGRWWTGFWGGNTSYQVGQDYLDGEDMKGADKPHYHEHLREVYLTRSGRGVLKVKSGDETTDVELEPGVAVLVEPEEIHAVTEAKELDIVVANVPSIFFNFDKKTTEF